MIKQLADLRVENIRTSSYLLGYLSMRVEQFLVGNITKKQLADDSAFIELLRALDARCSTVELREIAAGTRELPGEDVQSGQ